MENTEVTSPINEPAIDIDAIIEAKYANAEFPSLLKRIQAMFIDVIIILAAFIGVTIFTDKFGDIPGSVKAVMLLFMFFLYDPLLTAFTGSTIGHKIMGLTVRKFDDPNRNISFGYALIRFATKSFLGWISFLTVTSNKYKRALHDMAGGSVIMCSR